MPYITDVSTKDKAVERAKGNIISLAKTATAMIDAPKIRKEAKSPSNRIPVPERFASLGVTFALCTQKISGAKPTIPSDTPNATATNILSLHINTLYIKLFYSNAIIKNCIAFLQIPKNAG